MKLLMNDKPVKVVSVKENTDASVGGSFHPTTVYLDIPSNVIERLENKELVTLQIEEDDVVQAYESVYGIEYTSYPWDEAKEQISTPFLMLIEGNDSPILTYVNDENKIKLVDFKKMGYL